MPVRPIVLHPDPVLRQVCHPVDQWDVALQQLADDMLETMYAAPGRGLAAPQIGVTQRVFVMDATWKDGFFDPMVFVNPVITARSDQLATHEEGCLSIPGRAVQVARPDRVVLRWQGVDGGHMSQAFTGFAAVCVQHELDHLDGILCIDESRAQ